MDKGQVGVSSNMGPHIEAPYCFCGQTPSVILSLMSFDQRHHSCDV